MAAKLFSHSYPDDFKIRIRTKHQAAPAVDDSSCSIGQKLKRSRSETRPWHPNAAMTTSSCTLLKPGTSNYNNAVTSQRASSSNTEGKSSADTEGVVQEKTTNKEDTRPLPYHDYNPILVQQVQSDEELPIRYWFYVYLYSSDVDKLLTPFVKMVDNFGSDRRLSVIMNRCKVQILLKELELYKSLPRRIVVIKAAQWTNVVKALLEMEDRLPDLMRFATYPMLLDTDTTKYACTKFDRTACIGRMSRPIY